MTKILALSTLLGLMVSLGCSKTPPPATPDDAPSSSRAASPAVVKQKEAVAQAVQENQGGGLGISPEIMALCPGIKPPQFGFDSADVRTQWDAALKALSDCMQTGGLAGKAVLLTGHTDPRGDDDYNMALGDRRAHAVKSAIETFGVEGKRVEVTSRGKVDATGTDEDGWAHDRRVDIGLLKGAGVSAR